MNSTPNEIKVVPVAVNNIHLIKNETKTESLSNRTNHDIKNEGTPNEIKCVPVAGQNIKTEPLSNGTNNESRNDFEEDSDEENDDVVPTGLNVFSDDELMSSPTRDSQSGSEVDLSMEPQKDESIDGPIVIEDSQDLVISEVYSDHNQSQVVADHSQDSVRDCQDGDNVEDRDDVDEGGDSNSDDGNENAHKNEGHNGDDDDKKEDIKDYIEIKDDVDDLDDDDDDDGEYDDNRDNSNDNPQLSNQENASSSIEYFQNSDLESSEVEEDTVEDTKSSGRTDIVMDPNVTENFDNRGASNDTFKIVTINEHHSEDEMESTTSDCSDSDESTINIHFDCFNRQGGEESATDTKVIVIEHDGNNIKICDSPKIDQQIIEINDDDELWRNMSVDKQLSQVAEPAAAVETTKAPMPTNVEILELRSSNQQIKRKKFDDHIQILDDDGSDIEEVVVDQPMKQISTNNSVNTTKTLIDLTAEPIQIKTYSNLTKATTAIIDTPASVKNHTPINESAAPILNQSIYEKIIARGTSVTPIYSNNTAPAKQMITQGTQVSPTPPTPILPTLEDNMFVVEAPSFIVPYLYEGPPKLPFKEFVTNLGEQIEEEKIKERLLLEIEREEKAKQERDKKKRAEEAEGSEVEEESEKKERKRYKNGEDDVSWDGSSSSESEDISDEDTPTTIINDKADAIDQRKDCTNIANEPTSQPKSYFDNFLGQFFIDIGMNLVQEQVQTDLLKQQNRKLQREKKGGHDLKDREQSIALLTKNLELSQKTNEPFTFNQIKCKFCSFKTESALTMAHHLEIPHMRNNHYKCNYCTYEIQNPHEIIHHMEKEHNVKGKLERVPAPHQCPNCPFEDNNKGKLTRHMTACAKKFKPDSNLAPPLEWEHPAKITKMQRPRTNATTNQMRQSIQTPESHMQFPLPILDTAIHAGYNTRISCAPRTTTSLPAERSCMVKYNNNFESHNNHSVMQRPRTNAAANQMRQSLQIPESHMQFPLPLHDTAIHAGYNTRISCAPRTTTPLPTERSCMVKYNNNFESHNNRSVVSKMAIQPSISITPVLRSVTASTSFDNSQSTEGPKYTIVCEICDTFIRDLEQLRSHMHWVHKTKIHPKMSLNKPPLNCQKCHYRFFTDQGLERHLLGMHQLVSNAMQEAANRGQDSGKCPICGRVYQWKILLHMSYDHKMFLRPAYLSYKCNACTASFSLYRQFESHIYAAHSIISRRPSEFSSRAHANEYTARLLRINSDITITPQPINTSGAGASMKK